MPEYAVLDKDTINNWIMPNLSVAKRGFTTKFDLTEIVNSILYKLKSGCQWSMLPVGHLFTGEPPSWNTVFHHYRKWSKAGVRLMIIMLIQKNGQNWDYYLKTGLIFGLAIILSKELFRIDQEINFNYWGNELTLQTENQD